MRGAQIDVVQGDVARGIIPADAGSTTALAGPWVESEDHPRGCGEHTVWRRFETGRDRIIPADAGSTAIIVGTIWLVQDHPRGCGEHSQ